MSGNANSGGARDASSLRILGVFFALLGVLVLIGTYWARDNTRAMVVNVAGGLALVAAGLASWFIARRLTRVPRDSLHTPPAPQQKDRTRDPHLPSEERRP